MLDRADKLRVLSIEYEIFGPLEQALSSHSEPVLSCKSIKLLLNPTIHLASDARSVSILLVFESGFNSSNILKDSHFSFARIVLSVFG